MRILISTFREGDLEKLTLAMRRLPYDKLVILGTELDTGSASLSTVKKLEEMAGHEVEVDELDEEDFLTLVDEVSAVLSKYSLDPKTNSRNSITLNISGGSKLLGDASLFAAFRMGIETYHCENRVTKLPVIRGVTARDRFTPMQLDLIAAIGRGQVIYEDLVRLMEPASKQSTDRLIRELKKQGILGSEFRSSRIFVFLSDTGREVLNAIRLGETANS
ncbi:MAG: hypothetical protein A3K76_00865 [Euryarchaeota archaeon RBG_13_57_23]|nr:MAG: hypothetical protein A3K76_00865 [Euryarchaeota archaeon RBG_13_57_23]